MSSRTLKIGIIGDFEPGKPSHAAIGESLSHAARELGVTAEPEWLPTKKLEKLEYPLPLFDVFWAAPGRTESRGGAFLAIRFARENLIPFLGTCGGFQNTLLEYAHHVLNMKDAEHEETSPGASMKLITKLSCALTDTEQKVKLAPESRAHQAYGRNETLEKFNCKFGLNPQFRESLEKGDLKITGTDESGEARIAELTSHRFFVATLFVPQLSSAQERPHPLITAFLKTVVAN